MIHSYENKATSVSRIFSPIKTKFLFIFAYPLLFVLTTVWFPPIGIHSLRGIVIRYNIGTKLFVVESF